MEEMTKLMLSDIIHYNTKTDTKYNLLDFYSYESGYIELKEYQRNKTLSNLSIRKTRVLKETTKFLLKKLYENYNNYIYGTNLSYIRNIRFNKSDEGIDNKENTNINTFDKSVNSFISNIFDTESYLREIKSEANFRINEKIIYHNKSHYIENKENIVNCIKQVLGNIEIALLNDNSDSNAIDLLLKNIQETLDLYQIVLEILSYNIQYRNFFSEKSNNILLNACNLKSIGSLNTNDNICFSLTDYSLLYTEKFHFNIIDCFEILINNNSYYLTIQLTLLLPKLVKYKSEGNKKITVKDKEVSNKLIDLINKATCLLERLLSSYSFALLYYQKDLFSIDFIPINNNIYDYSKLLENYNNIKTTLVNSRLIDYKYTYEEFIGDYKDFENNQMYTNSIGMMIDINNTIIKLSRYLTDKHYFGALRNIKKISRNIDNRSLIINKDKKDLEINENQINQITYSLIVFELINYYSNKISISLLSNCKRVPRIPPSAKTFKIKSLINLFLSNINKERLEEFSNIDKLNKPDDLNNHHYIDSIVKEIIDTLVEVIFSFKLSNQLFESINELLLSIIKEFKIKNNSEDDILRFSSNVLKITSLFLENKHNIEITEYNNQSLFNMNEFFSLIRKDKESKETYNHIMSILINIIRLNEIRLNKEIKGN